MKVQSLYLDFKASRWHFIKTKAENTQYYVWPLSKRNLNISIICHPLEYNNNKPESMKWAAVGRETITEVLQPGVRHAF